MAEELRKYKYDASSGTRPNTASALKSEILRSLKADISEMIKSKLKSALADDFSSLKNEMQALKTEIINNTAVIHSKIPNEGYDQGSGWRAISKVRRSDNFTICGNRFKSRGDWAERKMRRHGGKDEKVQH